MHMENKQETNTLFLVSRNGGERQRHEVTEELVEITVTGQKLPTETADTRYHEYVM